MELENDLLEWDKELLKTDKELVSLLKKIVPDYDEKIKYTLSYSHRDKRYELSIKSLDETKEPSSFFSDSSQNDLRIFCVKYNIDFSF